MRIFEVMTEGVRTVPSSLPASEARDLMRTSRIHHLVVTSGARVVGILSDRDVGGRIRAAVLAGNTVADLMTSAPLLIGFLLFQRQFVQSFMRAGIK